MLVLKFGGTSMGSVAALQNVIRIVQEKSHHSPLAVVVSAMNGATDGLINSGIRAARGDESYREIIRELEQRHLEAVKALVPIQQQSSLLSFVKKSFNDIEDICNGIFLLQEFSPRVKDKLTAFGEWISSRMMSVFLESTGIQATWKDSRELIRTDSRFGNATVDFTVTNEQVRHFFHTHPARITILPGFIANDPHGDTTTLGRGGSDYTAAILAAALHAQALEIWTDVSGMMTADPRWVANARVIPAISYEEAMELSHFGAKVIYPPTIQPVLEKNIPIWIKNTFHAEAEGTVIERKAQSAGIITGLSGISSLALLSLEGSGMVGIPGFSKRLFEALAKEQINVILITQSSSEHSISVGIDAVLAQRAKHTVDAEFVYEISIQRLNPLVIEEGLSIVALVGENMRHHTGVSGRMFSALGRNGINIRAIAQGSSERNISAVIATHDVRKALNVLHEEFFETTRKLIHLYIAGTGNVGKRFIAQLHQQEDYLAHHLRLQFKIAGLCNSRRMLLTDDGIPMDDWEANLEKSQSADIEHFAKQITEKNQRNAVFVDITASEKVAQVYEPLLRKSVAVVACNKIAASAAFSSYRSLKERSREFNAPFLFETNVGAGLPVIATLNDLIRSGDRVHRILAVLSGTLNFVFNHYDGSRSFASVVRQAQDEGYTEPDPRLDLSGKDVMRKILILAREAGVELEMEQITCHAFLPESCMQGSVTDFYAEMEKQEAHFRQIYEAAKSENAILKFVASYENGQAAVGLQHIRPEHDLFHLYGKDNVVLFYTDRYPEQPLVIKGAGAGAEVTASGVFADVLRAVQF